MKILKLIAFVLIVFALGLPVRGQSTAISYQGNLSVSSAPANGNYDFEFRLFDAASAGTQLGPALSRSAVPVADGHFSVSLDFGGEFPGSQRYLDIRVRLAGSGAFTPLAPRQPITSAPYSIKSINAENATNAANASTATNATQLGGVAANQYLQTNGNGSGLTNLNAANITSGTLNPARLANGVILNTTTQQPTSNFNISGTGTASILSAGTQFNIGGSRILSNAGTNNLFAGVGTAVGNTGSNNSFFGVFAGNFNTTGTFNSFFGSRAGFSNTQGVANSFFGMHAGNANLTGSNNTIIGYEANVGANNLANATALGSSALVTQNNSLVLGSIAGVNNATANTSVGIGTTAPLASLDVRGSVFVGLTTAPSAPFSNAIFLQNDFGDIQNSFRLDAASDDLYLVARSPAGSATGAGIIFRTGPAGGGEADRVAINPDGSVKINTLGTAGATALCRNVNLLISTCSSSARYKSNIDPFSSGLDIVRRLRPVSFNWKDGGMLDIGLVAEEVAKIEPLLTTTNDRAEIEGVKYDRIGVVLINAVKEQQAQIESQAEIIKRQQQQINALMKLVCAANADAAICKEEK